MGDLDYFLGLENVRRDKDIILSQQIYIRELLEKAGHSGSKPNDSLIFFDPVKYRQLVGALQYATLSRLDITFAVNRVCQFMHSPTENHWSAVKRILRYLQGTTHYGLLIRHDSTSVLHAFTDTSWNHLSAYSDADWGYMEDIKNQLLQKQLCQCFSLPEIRAATNEFDDELVIGQGGFGKVYKGSIKLGATCAPAAVKRLHTNSNQGAKEFWVEVEMLSKLRHCNLASLFGYCNDGKEMILVYEYLPQGTLEGCLYKSGTSLTWLQRLNICIGAARGLDYLHTGTGTKHGIIHRDVKSSNILLDENYAAKISDFGLAKVGPANQTHTFVSTGVKGTFGYMDPTYFYTNKLTRKSDVYAFGVVLFEVLCGRPAVDTSLDEEQWGLASWAQDCVREGKLSQIVDSSLRGQISTNSLEIFTQIAVTCLHSRPNQRPTMAEVITKLEFVMSQQMKMDPSSIESKLQKKVWFSLSAGVMKFSNLMTSCLVASESVDVNVKKEKKKKKKKKLLTASAKFLNENPYWRTHVAYLSDGIQVIVKRILTQLSQKKFVTVVSALGKIRHPNVLDLKAYYWGRGDALCVYKFTPNWNVASLLLSQNQGGSPTTFDWQLRFNIIIGITRGLFYLHFHEGIVHGDLKLNMILLDEKYNPMIANVGLLHLLPATPQRLRNNCAPEYTGSVNATTEIDVYSVGIIMLELLTGLSTQKDVHPVDLPTWVKSVPQEKWSTEAFDTNLRKENLETHHVMIKILSVSLQCVEYDPKARPTIQDVLEILEQIEV
uniref:receptor like protein kinase S.2-like n=1 Tax=Erigeron canadensis TaxID=72917 RepID=UPI001CB90252|nr:receptor like protein kinase S.2-like [Erigeron canadensis]